jgi:UDP-N-acetylmuramyl pentapeptide phosphotransferase/UDP-N-acetylglucosamine-1-phosphate transferase
MSDMLGLVVVFLLSAILSWFATGWVIRYLRRLDIIDRPTDRSSHNTDVVRGGGIAINVVMLIAAIAAMVLLPGAGSQLFTLAIIIFILAVVGYLDDRHQLDIAPRLAAQLAVGLIAVSAFGALGAGWLAWSLSVLWVVWIINTFNFMDGIDGIGAQQACICGAAMAVWFSLHGAYAPAVFAVSMSGAAMGFGPHNWSPASVFLGDTGSLALGGGVAALALLGVNDYDLPAAAFLVLYAVFLGDSTFTLARRLIAGRNVLNAHNEHLYQRAVRSGMSHVAVTKRVIALNLFLALLASMIVAGFGPTWLWVLTALLMLIVAAVRVTWLERGCHATLS